MPCDDRGRMSATASKICPGCGATTPESARRCGLCGAALRHDCPACAAELPRAARYCPYCGGRIATGGSGDPRLPALSYGARRRATILFSDLWGYTAFAESLDPEDVADVMNRLKDVATRVIELFGGTVNQFVGDQVMAAIVLNDDAQLTTDQFTGFLAAQRDLSPKAWPRYVWLADDLPSTATNKILKRELVAMGADPAGRVIWCRDGTGYAELGRA
jgi:class 3 adenylate cyclase